MNVYILISTENTYEATQKVVDVYVSEKLVVDRVNKENKVQSKLYEESRLDYHYEIFEVKT